MMKITSAHVWVGRRCTTGRDKLSQIASFDEQSALNCVIPPMFPPSHSTCTDDIIFSFSAVSIILLNLLLSQAQAQVFAGLLFQLTQGLVVNID